MTEDINIARTKLKQQGRALIQLDTYPVHSYPYDSPWIDEPVFSKLYDKIHNNTLVDRNRCYALYLLTQQVEDVPGDVLEVGTWRGGTAGILTTMCPNKQVYLADTFTGVVKSSDWEHYKDEAHSDTSRIIVENLLKSLSVNNFTILEGIFPEDTGNEMTAEKLSLVYLDVDVYQSTKDAFNFAWDRLSVNGIVVFDDYGMISACSGIKKFLDEISNDKDKIFLQNLNGQAYIIKKK